VHLSYSTFFSVFSIFQVLQFVFLIFHIFSLFSPYSRSYSEHFSISKFFSFSRHNPGNTVFVSHFPPIQVFSPYSRSYHVIFSLSSFVGFLAIFQVLQCACFIFHVFQFSRHFPDPSLCMFLFSTVCSVSRHIPGPTVCIISFFTFFSVSCHILGPKVCISHFPRFSVLFQYFRFYSEHFSFSTFFQFFSP